MMQEKKEDDEYHMALTLGYGGPQHTAFGVGAYWQHQPHYHHHQGSVDYGNYVISQPPVSESIRRRTYGNLQGPPGKVP